MSRISNDFDDVIDVALSRRKVLIGSGVAAAAFLAPQLAGNAAAKGPGNGKANGRLNRNAPCIALRRPSR